jgi:hypothetical protein
MVTILRWGQSAGKTVGRFMPQNLQRLYARSRNKRERYSPNCIAICRDFRHKDLRHISLAHPPVFLAEADPPKRVSAQAEAEMSNPFERSKSNSIVGLYLMQAQDI